MRATSMWMVGLSPALAQAPLAPAAAAFVPMQTTVEIFVDLAACREGDVLDDLRSSLYSGMLKRLEAQSGIDVNALDCVTVYVEMPKTKEASDELPSQSTPGGPLGIAILAGSAALRLPPVTAELRAIEVEGREARAMRGAFGDPDLLVQIEPGLLVFGAQSALAPRIAGSAPQGLVPNELRELFPEAGTLVRIAGFVNGPLLTSRLPPSVSPSWLPARAGLRLCTEMVEGEPVLAIELACRQFSNADSIKQLLAALDAQLQRLAETPQTKPLHALLGKLERGVDTDALKLRLTIGTTRDLLNVVQAVLPLFGAPPPAPPAAPSNGSAR